MNVAFVANYSFDGRQHPYRRDDLGDRLRESQDQIILIFQMCSQE
jgi:hypothetical protein